MYFWEFGEKRTLRFIENKVSRPGWSDFWWVIEVRFLEGSTRWILRRRNKAYCKSERVQSLRRSEHPIPCLGHYCGRMKSSTKETEIGLSRGKSNRIQKKENIKSGMYLDAILMIARLWKWICMPCASEYLSLWMPCAVQVLQHNHLSWLLMPCAFKVLDVWEMRKGQCQRHFKSRKKQVMIQGR